MARVIGPARSRFPPARSPNPAIHVIGVLTRQTYRFDDNGSPLYIETDDDLDPANGIIQRRMNTFDPHGRTLSFTIDRDLDDANGAEVTQVYRYEDGWLVETVRDDDDDPSNGVLNRTAFEVIGVGFGALFGRPPPR